MVAIERAENRLSSDQQDHLEQLVRRFHGERDAAYRVARWACITEAPAYRSAFWTSGHAIRVSRVDTAGRSTGLGLGKRSSAPRSS